MFNSTTQNRWKPLRSLMVVLPLTPMLLAAGSACSQAAKDEPKSNGATPKAAPQKAIRPIAPPRLNSLPKGAPQLKPMFLRPELFTPNKWWKYETYDDDRPPQYGVEQETKMVVGAQSVTSHGALVTYHVLPYNTPQDAHKSLLSMVSRTRRGKNVKRTETPIHQGDEAIVISSKLVSDRGVVVETTKQVVVRYGNYVVDIFGRSDLRAFGPRPKTGERRWMHEPVFDQVREAAMQRWTRYKSLIAMK